MSWLASCGLACRPLSSCLNERLDRLFENIENWTDEVAYALFDHYVCQCMPDGNDNSKMREELLGTVANILGMLIDLGGKTAISNTTLEKHMGELASSKDPAAILQIASEIVSETRDFVTETKKFEASLSDSTQEIQILKVELDDARRQATKDALTGLNNRRGFMKN